MKLPSMKPSRRFAARGCCRRRPQPIAEACLRLLMAVACCVAGSAGVSASEAAVDPDSLAWLVPADAGLVVEVKNLAPAAEAFLTGPLGQRWQQFPPLRRWWEQNREGALRMIDDVGRYLQVPPRDIWYDVFGHRVLLAAWPPQIAAKDNDAPAAEDTEGQTPRPQHPDALLILRAKQADTLARLVEGFCSAQQRFEQVQWTELSYNGVAIKRGASQRRPDLYVALLGDTALVSDTRRVIEAAINLASGRTRREQSLAATAAYRRAAAALPQAFTAWLFIPAPAWNDALAADAATSSGRAQQEKQQFLALWQGLNSLNVTVQLDRQIVVQGLVQLDGTRWPKPVQTVWDAVSGPTALARQMPAESLVAVAGKLDTAMVVDGIVGQSGQRQPEGWRLVRNCLAVLAGDFGGYVIDGQGDLPVDWVLAASVLPRWKDVTAAGTPGEFLQVALGELLGLASLQRPELTVQYEPAGQHTLLVLKYAPAAEPTRQVALAVAKDWLWASSSPPAMEHALADGGERLADAAAFAGSFPKELPAPSGFFYVNAARSRALLEARGEQLARAIAEARHQDVNRVSRGLRQLHAVLELFDRALVATQITADAARLAVTVAAD